MRDYAINELANFGTSLLSDSHDSLYLSHIHQSSGSPFCKTFLDCDGPLATPSSAQFPSFSEQGLHFLNVTSKNHGNQVGNRLLIDIYSVSSGVQIQHFGATKRFLVKAQCGSSLKEVSLLLQIHFHGRTVEHGAIFARILSVHPALLIFRLRIFSGKS